MRDNVLANPLSLVQWTLAKSYLRDLEQQGAGIVPSIWSDDIDATQIPSEGEFSLFYFSGEYSHAILKVPKDGDFRVQEEYGGDIQSVQPPRQLLDAGQHVLSLVYP